VRPTPPDQSKDSLVTSRDEEVDTVGAGPWNLVTKNQYRCDEVVSALQKAIRRGDCDAAVYWAHELNISGFGAWA